MIPRDRTYTPEQVCAIADLPKHRLSQWLARQFLPFGPPPGQGKARRFTYDQLLAVSLMVKLVKGGMAAARAAHYAQTPIDVWWEMGSVLLLIPASSHDEPKGVDPEEEITDQCLTGRFLPQARIVTGGCDPERLTIPLVQPQEFGETISCRWVLDDNECITILNLTKVVNKMHQNIADVFGDFDGGKCSSSKPD